MFELKVDKVLIPFWDRLDSFFQRNDISDIYALDETIYIFCSNNFLKTSEIFTNILKIGLFLERYKAVEIDRSLEMGLIFLDS